MSEYLSPESQAAGFPDLRPHFRHLHNRKMPHSAHNVCSDFADAEFGDPILGIYKNCGFQTRDEVSIQWRYAKQVVGEGATFLDIGAHTGWVSLHFAYADGNPPLESPDPDRVGDARDAIAVFAVDPMYRSVDERFAKRFVENTQAANHRMFMFAMNSVELVEHPAFGRAVFGGVSVDGDHEKPWPLHDVMLAHDHLAGDGFIALHDAWGEPVAEAARWLLQMGYKVQWYDTPHGLVVARRGNVKLEPHTPDPGERAAFAAKRRATNFPFERCS